MRARLLVWGRRPGLRYLLIGGSVYLLELAVIFGAQRFGANAVTAVALSFWVGLVVSFALQKLVTFNDQRFHHRILIPQIVAFSCLVLFNFSFTIGVAKLLSGLVGPAISRTIALGITTIWNFYLYKTRIFKPAIESN
ncbi:MAG: GtrA family protein [Candidatus Saccharibacteria bacterium]